MAGGVTVGSAFVQIVPSAQGLKGSISNILNKEAGSAGESSGKNVALGLAKKLGGAMAAAGVGAAIAKGLKASLGAGGTYEQLEGGVKKLFGNDAMKTVIGNANKAFSTAGMSANKYMDTVTSFSASLISSLGGNTAKAAKHADLAIRDMSDNANTFGTDMEAVQNAYQGFAKGNFTMLDNLKLGYGGTQTEMLRLVNDSGVLKEKVDDIKDVSFDDMILAIHKIQENMNITGTTAKEASGTLEGSFNSMKASAENFLTSLATGNNVKDSLGNLLSTFKDWSVGNLLPMLGQIFSSLGSLIVEGFSNIDWASVGPNIYNGLQSMLSKGIELVRSKLGNSEGGNLLAGLFQNMSKYVTYIRNVFGGIMQNISPILTEIKDNMVIAFQTAWTAIQPLLPVLQSLWDKLTGTGNQTRMISVFSNVFSVILKTVVVYLKGYSIVMRAVGSVIRTVIATVKNIITAFQTFKTTVTTTAQNILTSVRTKFNAVKNAIITPIRSAINRAQGMWGTFKAKLSAPFRLMSGLRVPHISVTGGSAPYGIAGMGTKPTISVKWNKEGGIFDAASIIGYGVGEAGAEAIVPLDRFWNTLDEKLGSVGSSSGGTGVVTIMLDGSVIAKSTIDYINGQVQRYGTSPITV